MVLLGKRHNKSYGIPPESYEHFVRAMVYAMKRTFVEEFNPRVEYCLSTLCLWIAQVMRDATETEKIIKEMSEHNISEFPVINDYDQFLEDPKCVEYFHLHLVREFCEENILFYGDALIYRDIGSEIERRIRAKELQIFIFHGLGPLQ
eukprot:TRINITY_DN1334_c0_g1_i2.p1 TRINITY_DN1334_c0_g1~~TRINITY_DN1334_c0_g1_i2.p1  ORF type:complete len:148 (-),score=21.84 TRINITY_DN1334_c0_g1_i2:360-803(-)